MSNARVMEILGQAQALASEYRALTGKPLGVTGEVAEYHAARLLGLTLAEARTKGYDATRPDGTRVQIKGRVVLPDSKPGQRVGTIKHDAPCDTVLLVLMDQFFNPTIMFEASMETVRARLLVPGSRARARGSLGVPEFRKIAQEVWRHD